MPRSRFSRQRLRSSAPLVESLEARTLLSSVELLKDVNPLDRYPTLITQSGAYTYYVAHSLGSGNDLDRTDGTVEGTSVIKHFPGYNALGGHPPAREPHGRRGDALLRVN